MILSEKASAFFIENLISKSTDNKKPKLNNSINNKVSNSKNYRAEDLTSTNESNPNSFSCSSSSSASSFSSLSQHNSPYASHLNPKCNTSPTHECVSPVSSNFNSLTNYFYTIF